MELLQHILSTDPAAPRLTVYTETTGARMDFSAQTLDNWAAKVANLLEEELELAEGDCILIDLPVSWQAAVIALGALAARVDVRFGGIGELAGGGIDAVFTSPDNADAALGAAEAAGADVLAVTDDAFGRGVAEMGGRLPAGVIDFGPTVRFYGDQYVGPAPALPSVVTPGSAERLLSTGWLDGAGFEEQVLTPIAAGGSAVVVSGLVTADRLDAIAEAERVTARA